jgi:hypothetical protein
MKRRTRPIPGYKARRLAREFEREVAERILTQFERDIEMCKAIVAGSHLGGEYLRQIDVPQVH